MASAFPFFLKKRSVSPLRITSPRIPFSSARKDSMHAGWESHGDDPIMKVSGSFGSTTLYPEVPFPPAIEPSLTKIILPPWILSAICSSSSGSYGIRPIVRCTCSGRRWACSSKEVAGSFPSMLVMSASVRTFLYMRYSLASVSSAAVALPSFRASMMKTSPSRWSSGSQASATSSAPSPHVWRNDCRARIQSLGAFSSL
mmetsp:Transcript_8744/g.24666  ORF Transcript_8744/g.24666 Transcript_8744/m.24666 type:complete len:200 (-) Transcript_8744:232-831(-)